MANGISRRSFYEALRAATDDTGRLDLWRAASLLADDVESWGEPDFDSHREPGDEAPHRFWRLTKIEE